MSTLHARLVRTLTVLALTLPLVAVSTGAQAKTLAHMDGRGDVATPDPTDENHQRMVVAPDQVVGDIVGIRYRHTSTRLQVRIRFADLRRVRGTSLIVHMVTNEGRTRDLRLWSVADLRDPDHRQLIGQVMRRAGGLHRVRCPIYRSWNYRDNVMTFGFPRTCAGRPRWVRIGVVVHTGTRWDMQIGLLVDDPQTGVQQLDTLIPKLSRRIYRG